MKRKFAISNATLIAGLLALAGTTPTAQAFTNLNSGYVEVKLVSDISSNALRTDPRLVNPWGLIAGPAAVWVNDNGPGLTTVYSPFGGVFPFAINIPGPGGMGAGTPSGLIFNDTFQFTITNGTNHARSIFLASTEDGTIAAVNFFVTGSNAVLAVDRSASGAVYKGLAIARLTNGMPQLYAANFHANLVDVFDGNFNYVTSFTDTNLPAFFAPFNLKNIGGKLFVTYAMQKLPDLHDDQAGPGNGYIDVFAPDGTLLNRFASQGPLNSPWGMAVAPWNFGPFSRALLVGNFGDGHINAYNLSTGSLLGHLTKPDGSDLVIDGLWGLDFQPLAAFSWFYQFVPPRLYFTAGINDEADGLFGFVRWFTPFEWQY